jgi:hypothetical protein
LSGPVNPILQVNPHPAKKFEFHFTPKKGSWLNMAEIEFAALSRQCLNRRIGDIKTLAKEAAA